MLRKYVIPTKEEEETMQKLASDVKDSETRKAKLSFLDAARMIKFYSKRHYNKLFLIQSLSNVYCGGWVNIST